MAEPTNPPTAPQVIQSYGNGGFTVSGTRHDGSIIVFRDRALPWTPPESLAVLGLDDFAALTDSVAAVDIVLLGCGVKAVQLTADLRASLRRRGVTVEAMDTGAACRTFNLLQIEGRRVAAMVVAVP